MMIALIIDLDRVWTLYLIWQQKNLLAETNPEFNTMHQLVYYFNHCHFPNLKLSLIQTISKSVTRKTKLIQRHQNKLLLFNMYYWILTFSWSTNTLGDCKIEAALDSNSTTTSVTARFWSFLEPQTSSFFELLRHHVFLQHYYCLDSSMQCRP